MSYKTSKSAAESIVKIIDKYSGFSTKKQILDSNTTTLSNVSKAEELEKYKKLLNDGAITEEEYSKIKEKLISDYVNS